MNKYQRVKIIATLGPASDSPEMIEELSSQGVDVFRLNLTHSNPEEATRRIEAIRIIETKLRKSISIMGDLGGPKIRTGEIPKERDIQTDETLFITKKDVLGDDSIYINYPEILENLEAGSEVYLGDGVPKLEVVKVNPDGIETKVIVGGRLKSRMGFSAQGLQVKSVDVSEADSKWVKLLDKLNVDSVAVSFVQNQEDILKVRKLFSDKYKPFVIAKIETMAGLENIESILEVADGIMVARGDLGFAMPMEELPLVQKHLIKVALKHAKPVITATQMLESMTFSHLPTRAEVSDVANAILDGTDAIMLSGETARGKYPAEAVKMMVKIIDKVEKKVEPQEFPMNPSIADAVSASAVKVADQVDAKLLIVFTETGSTAQRISRHRHSQPIIALSPNAMTLHKLNFCWGVRAYSGERVKTFKDALPQAVEVAKSNDIVELKKGDPFVVCAGLSFGESGTTNMVIVEKVPD